MDSLNPTPAHQPEFHAPLEVTDGQHSALIDDTLALLNDGVPSKENEYGMREIERWAEVLRATEKPGLAKIIQALDNLREQLTGDGATEAHDLAETLATLGAETSKVADEAAGGYGPPLAQLGKLLIKMGSTLSR
ncbi:hypothetical protein F0P96_09680 [Hymenobacter busanensis]|uniref:Uncharacterized protein n=1 Tax=Hymenobacter busanensis TaxID=2607656 RepID=A0A7L4ZZ77_9BACT|nr:hypothetical protein [Hymenobacter busanensis]KAA9333238.1 hypothetical protein F0P96_09680 [Hymenobacter busanensis]QHJ08085.1 hypothetical protein GUY19_12640 [Hymenobacter busanensis]